MNKNKRGSILAYSLIILAMMLTIATSLSVSALAGKKGASSTESSMQSLQAADGGVQRALKKINSNLTNPINHANMYGAFCNGGVVKNLADAGQGTYELSFYSDNGTMLASCDALANTIKNIKSVGTYKNTVRAVSVAVAAPVAPCSASTPSGSSCNFGGLIYGTLTGDDTKIWLDRNLGATNVATAFDDDQSYGWYFQWGRGTDGHQINASSVTAALSASDNPGHSNFIVNASGLPPQDWRDDNNNNRWNIGANNPCPTGFRLPTQADWAALIAAEGITNSATAFSSSLKLPAAGIRSRTTGASSGQDTLGYYWSSSVPVTGARTLRFDSSTITSAGSYARAYGFSVRCMKE